MTNRHDPSLRRLIGRIRHELAPKIEESPISICVPPAQVHTDGAAAGHFAVELGIMIMLDTPLILVVQPGMQLPDKLVRIADHIVEGDIASQTGQDRLMTKIAEIVRDLP